MADGKPPFWLDFPNRFSNHSGPKIAMSYALISNSPAWWNTPPVTQVVLVNQVTACRPPMKDSVPPEPPSAAELRAAPATTLPRGFGVYLQLPEELPVGVSSDGEEAPEPIENPPSDQAENS